jgi:hypothetical protein
MSTTAQDCHDKAIAHIKEAIKHISVIVVDQCDGHDEYSSTYRHILKTAMTKLIEIRDDI